jgi:DNA-binding LytR/AlgR family response regulator
MELSCLIVDDELLSRELLKHFIQKTDFLRLDSECHNGLEAANLLQKTDNEIDIVYLDLEMPEMGGMDLVRTLEHRPEIILTTSSEDKAVEAFEFKVTDYVVKPVDYNRFFKASIRAKESIELQRKKSEKYTDIYIKSNSRFYRIEFANILYIEALADYVIFHTVTHGKLIVHYTMKGIEKRLPESQFKRVHRSFIVNLRQIELLEDVNIQIGKKIIPVGASYKEGFMKELNFL